MMVAPIEPMPSVTVRRTVAKIGMVESVMIFVFSVMVPVFKKTGGSMFLRGPLPESQRPAQEIKVLCVIMPVSVIMTVIVIM